MENLNSPRTIRAAERKQYRDGIQGWFDTHGPKELELDILSFIAQQVDLNGPGNSAEGVASAAALVALNRLKIDYTEKKFKDRAKDFTNKAGYDQRYTNMGVIQYFRNAAAYILLGTAWDPALPAGVHLKGNTKLFVEKDVFLGLKDGSAMAKKFETEAAEAKKGNNPLVSLDKYVVYVLKPIWSSKGLKEVAKYAFKAGIPGFNGEAETNVGRIVLFPQQGGPGFNNDVGMKRDSWIAMEILHLLWMDMEENIFSYI